VDNASGNHANFGTGKLLVQDSAVTLGTPLALSDGAVGTPSLTFSSDLNTGLYWISADRIGVTAGGSKVLEVVNSGGTFGLGIGMSPSVVLDVQRSSTDWVARVDQTGSSAGAKGLQIKSAATGATDSVLSVDVSGATRFVVQASGFVGIGDTTNAFMTQGLTINQAGNDDEILALKSSDVAHGVTTITETDTYALFKKLTAASGGLLVRGINGGAVIGFQVSATGTGEDTAKSAGATGTVYLNANKISGTGAAALGANGNLLTVASAGNTRFIVDAEGDIHADSGSATANTGNGYLVYDEFEDAELVRALDVERAGPGLIKTEFDRMLRYGRADLEAANIATFNDHKGGDGSIFVNYSALTRLLSGAAWQAAVRIRQIEAELMEIKQRMLPA
jgi:hypothetical protein